MPQNLFKKPLEKSLKLHTRILCKNKMILAFKNSIFIAPDCFFFHELPWIFFMLQAGISIGIPRVVPEGFLAAKTEKKTFEKAHMKLQL